jgi:uncharacterized Fe-S cluster-containing radical SAM superfamily protein
MYDCSGIVFNNEFIKALLRFLYKRGEVVHMKTMEKIQQELLLKEIRTAYWELNHSIPTRLELEKLEMEGLI